MNRQKGRIAWIVLALTAVGGCALTGALFGEPALWGMSAVLVTLYIGALAIWFSRLTTQSSGLAGERVSSVEIPSLRTGRAACRHSGLEANWLRIDVGSPRFSELAHELADCVDDPIDIVDTARRAGLSMRAVRTGGSQTPLNLWTAVLTRAVREGGVARLMAEVLRSERPASGIAE